jgi:hypothetical protein
MTNTTKKAPTRKQATESANEANIQNALLGKLAPRGSGLRGQIKASEIERRVQIAVEKMQAAMLQDKFNFDSVVAKGAKRLADIKKTERVLINNNVKPVSNYDTLAILYKKDLDHLSEDVFMGDAGIQAIKFLSQFQSAPTEEQRETVIKFYKARAKAQSNIVQEIHDLLVHKKAIKASREQVKNVEESTNLEKVGEGIMQTV